MNPSDIRDNHLNLYLKK